MYPIYYWAEYHALLSSYIYFYPRHMKDGQTALMWAAKDGSHETVNKLLEFGASVDTIDKVGMTDINKIDSAHV